MKKKILSLVLCAAMLAGTGTTVFAEEVKEMDTLDIFINMSWYPTDEMTGIMPELIKEATNVDLNVTIATDPNQLGVMIGSNEIPDLVFTDLQLDRLSNEKFCYSFEELESEYGASFAETSEEAKKIAKTLSEDGKYYTLLNNYASTEEYANIQIGAPGQPCIYYRRDLLGDLSGREIATMDDFMKALGECKEKFPDMTPFGQGGVYKMHTIKRASGVDASMYDEETGDYYYEATAPKYKEFLQTANTMAREGYITAEAYANESEADSHQAAYNGGCVFYPWYLNLSSLSQLRAESQKLNPEADWAILPKFGENALDKNRGWGGLFVSRNCSNPEAAARLLTYLHSVEGRRASMWGRDGVDFTVDENGVPEFSEEFKTSRADGSFQEKYNQWFYFGTTLVDEIYMNFSGADENDLNDVTTYVEGYRNCPELKIAEPLSSSDEGVVLAKMKEIQKSYEAKAIFASSDEEFEEVYEEYMKALEKTGVNEYNDYMKQAIQDVNAKMAE